MSYEIYRKQDKQFSQLMFYIKQISKKNKRIYKTTNSTKYSIVEWPKEIRMKNGTIFAQYFCIVSWIIIKSYITDNMEIN